MKILLYGLFLFVYALTFGQSNESIKKLNKAHSYYATSNKKAKEARAIIDDCFSTNRIDIIKIYARDGGLIASNAGVYSSYAEVIAREVKQSAGVCPYAKYLSDIAEEYFSQAQQNFYDAYYELSKINSTDDMTEVNSYLQNAICFLSEGMYQLDSGNDQTDEVITAIKNNCSKRY